MNAAISARLRTLRIVKGLTLREVEQLSNRRFRAPSLSRYETGRRRLSLDQAEALAETYGLSVQELLFGASA